MKSDQNIVVGDMVGIKSPADPRSIGHFGVVNRIDSPGKRYIGVNGQTFESKEIVYIVNTPTYKHPYGSDHSGFFRNNLYKIAGPSIKIEEEIWQKSPVEPKVKIPVKTI